MADRPLSPAGKQASFNSSSNTNHPSPSLLRQRSLGRSSTVAEPSIKSPPYLRRSSTLSDSLSEARQSIRSSTDDLLFPRAHKGHKAELQHEEESHWHSAPLALALLPAAGGIFFKNGSAVVTDISLLILAAVFLNWSVRLPWEWYRSSQAIRVQDIDFINETIIEEESDDEEVQKTKLKDGDMTTNAAAKINDHRSRQEPAAQAAAKELMIHELAALASCFIFPLLGAWLLHTIRDKLSRPSEGLVSNYNLTIFLLAAEIRPFAHLLRMVQARTLHLQRIVTRPQFSSDDGDKIDKTKFSDVLKRLEELEVHIADSAAAKLAPNASYPDSLTKEQHEQHQQHQQHEQLLQDIVVGEVAANASKEFQSELDALNRAMRRYEKRTALMAFQIDNRLQGLENQVRDSLALAAAAERSTARQRYGSVFIILDWIYVIVVLPVRMLLSIASLPTRIAAWGLQNLKLLFEGGREPNPARSSSSNKGASSSLNGRGKQAAAVPRSSGRAFDRRALRRGPSTAFQQT